MSLKLTSVPDRPDAAACSEEGLVVADASAAAAAFPMQPTVHIVASVGSETFEFDVPADRTVEFVKAYLDNKHGCVTLCFFIICCAHPIQHSVRQADVALERSCAH
jgi:hypothetical protein